MEFLCSAINNQSNVQEREETCQIVFCVGVDLDKDGCLLSLLDFHAKVHNKVLITLATSCT